MQDLSCYVWQLSDGRTDILLPLAKIHPEFSTKEDRIVHANGEILVTQDTSFRTLRKLYYLFHLQKDDFLNLFIFFSEPSRFPSTPLKTGFYMVKKVIV